MSASNSMNEEVYDRVWKRNGGDEDTDGWVVYTAGWTKRTRMA